ncbi:hypothetical protein CTAYLR_003079 [Chrysophaeum taylorii]|uniref:Uncharacterized protein n=1 Tax=Chrysophaeum taylorii TaxID=2483200 RepID=A0AAD7U5F5_9STRA|nr:hypothetical protein CTAYLR_003079 [Chrysophaeum taylorii]
MGLLDHPDVHDHVQVAPDGTRTLAGIPVVADGLVIYGVPIGSPGHAGDAYVEATLQREVDAQVSYMSRIRTKLQNVSLHCMYSLGRYCIAPRMDYIAQHCYPTNALSALRRFDVAALSFVATALGADPRQVFDSNGIVLQRLRLPARSGGGGIRSCADLSPAAFVGTAAQALPHLVDLRDPTGNELHRWHHLLASGCRLGRALETAWDGLRADLRTTLASDGGAGSGDPANVHLVDGPLSHEFVSMGVLVDPTISTPVLIPQLQHILTTLDNKEQLYDIKTLAWGSLYTAHALHPSHPSPVDRRAAQVHSEYLAHARGIDAIIPQPATAPRDKKVAVWRHDGVLRLETEGIVYGVALCPERVAAATTRGAVVWDLFQGRRLHTLHGEWVRCAAYCGEVLATGADDRAARLWDRDGINVATFGKHTQGVVGIAVSPRHVATASEAVARLFDRESQSLIRAFRGHRGDLLCVAIRGPYLATGSADRTVKLWDIEARALLRTFEDHTAWVHAVAFFQDALLSAGADKTLRIVPIDGSSPEVVFDAHQGAVLAIAVDEALVATGSADKTAKAEPHWMFVFFFAHLLFWLVGFQWDPARIYSDNHYNHDGGIPSGPSGSGVFIISSMLMVVATITVAVKAVTFEPETP